MNAADLRPGDRVAHYKILEPLGEGGFAVVYLAEQIEPVRRRVALKIIKLGMDTKQVIARFEAERQALAMMEHPNVAKVYDAGVSDQGRSYFVMEHVPGVSITEHCDRQRLSIDQRLDLFMQVCEAVQHAHQKGIIHRDLKPSNVLVTTEEARTVPKVIDFGVAKALHQRLTEKTIFTEQGQLIGTPEYMSPEQAEMTAHDIDTRSDIYSLGVLLYELLTGALPFDPTTLRQAAFAEIQRIIREQEPPKPSTRLSSLGDESSIYAQMRRGDPRSLLRELRGDLDWITMKALEKDRTRRYETADGLAMDIRRHLDHQPVVAGPPSAAYKLSKFVRRNRTGVLAGAVVAVALFGATGVSIGFALSEAEQRGLAEQRQQLAQDARDAESEARAEAQQRQQEAEVASEEALRQAEIAQTVNDFLTDDLLAAVAPSAEEGKGKDVLMRDVLDEAAKSIEKASIAGGRFDGKPLIEASIRATLGTTYLRLGEYVPAELHLKRALELRQAQLGDGHPDTVHTMRTLTEVVLELVDFNRGLDLLEKSLDGAREALVELRNKSPQDGPGEDGFSEILDIVDNNLWLFDTTVTKPLPSSEFGAKLLPEMADNLTRSATAALGPLESILDKVRSLKGDEHQTTLRLMNLQASLYSVLGEYEIAEPIVVTVLHVRERALGAKHPETLRAMNDVALVWERLERYEEARPLYEETLDLKREVLGERHPATLRCVYDLARLYRKLARYEAAKALSAEAVEGARHALGNHHPTRALYLLGHGQILTDLGSYEEAEAALLEAQEILEATFGNELRGNAWLADLYDAWGKPDKAAEWRAKLPEEEDSKEQDD